MLTKLYPAKLENDALEPARASSSGTANFLEKTEHLTKNHARLILALDATQKQQPVWDAVSGLQAGMFTVNGQKTGISVQIVYFRGLDECRASKWMNNAQAVYHALGHIRCDGDATQLSKVISHSRKEHEKRRISALVFIGSQVNEDIETLDEQAKEIGNQGLKIFVLQNGNGTRSSDALQRIATSSNGAFLQFDNQSLKLLEDALSAASLYATGGLRALATRTDKAAELLLTQLEGKET